MKHPKDRRLSPIDKPPEPIKFAAFDTETKTNASVYEIGGCSYEGDYQQFKNPDDLVKHMCTKKHRGVTWYAHNLTYDAGVLLKHMPEEFKFSFLSGKVLQGRLYPQKKQTHYLADSWRMFAGISLHDVGEKIGLPKYQTPSSLLPPEITTQIEYQVNHLPDVPVDEYLERDVEIVNKGIDLFQKEVNRLGGNMRLTLPSTAMDLFRRSYLKEEYKTPFQFYNDVGREAYYGGRVEPFQLGEIANVNVYDINSLHPSVMVDNEFPHPDFIRYTSSKTRLSYILQYEGVSNVTINVPETHIPLLPYRYNDRLYFPTGELTATYTHLELRHALQRGAIIKQIHYQLWSIKTVSPFNDFVTDLYNLRLEYKADNDAREHVIKILLNSFYGKFGERRDAGLSEIKSDFVFDDKTDLTGYEPIVFDDTVYFRRGVPMREQPVYTNTLWASYITAYARLCLYGYMEELGEHLIYCDTDSIFTTKTIATGKGLGHMKAEFLGVDVNIIGAKVYKLWAEHEIIATKVRGIPSAYQTQFLSSHEATFLKALGFFEAARRGLNPSQWVEITKHHCSQTAKRYYLDNLSSRIHQVHSRALTVDEVHSQVLLTSSLLI